MSEFGSLYLQVFVPYLVDEGVWLVFTGSSLYLHEFVPYLVDERVRLIIFKVSDPYLVDKGVWLVVFTGVIKHLDKVGGHVFYGLVLVLLHLQQDFLHVDRFFDHLIIIWVVLR